MSQKPMVMTLVSSDADATSVADASLEAKGADATDASAEAATFVFNTRVRFSFQPA